MLPTVLIADDNKGMRETLKSFVSDLVTVIGECEDGRDVVQLYRSIHPDFVLMDVAMRWLDGIEATKLLRREFPEAKVIIVSNYNDIELKQEAQNAGSIGFVEKEFLPKLRMLLK